MENIEKGTRVIHLHTGKPGTVIGSWVNPCTGQTIVNVKTGDKRWVIWNIAVVGYIWTGASDSAEGADRLAVSR